MLTGFDLEITDAVDHSDTYTLNRDEINDVTAASITDAFVDLVVYSNAMVDDMGYEIDHGNPDKALMMADDIMVHAMTLQSFETVMDYLNIYVPTTQECLEGV